MNSARLLALLSTVLLVVGALLVGEAIHGGVVTGTHPVTSPWVVLRLVVGAVFIALGYRFQTPADACTVTPSAEPTRSDQQRADAGTGDASTGDAGEASEFDSDLSPLGNDGLEHVETDDEE